MSTINAKLLADVYAALVVAEQRLSASNQGVYSGEAWATVDRARHDLRMALHRLPPVVVSITEPESVPEFLAAAV